MWKFFHQMASPPHFYRIAKVLIPWFAVPGLMLIAYGTYAGLFVASPDYQQGDAFRIIYIHVPAAYLSMMAYMIMAVGGGIGLIWRLKLAHAVGAAAAPLGATFTFLALVTGSIWGRPMWGTWWEWGDPRLTSELILLFLYFGYMALRSSIDDTAKADKASSVLALVGVVNVVIVHYSVVWWSSLHQGQTLFKKGGPAMDADMLYPLLAMILGFTFLFGAMLARRLRTEVLYRERRTRWVRDLVMSPEGGL
ncbi:MAG: heme ABC transporter permease CcmC [Gammaproteobacteria bacterium]|jgi:heme exporter protein C|nr:heme ABC transporter permease CcmC [Gammaproteobacteria bacterium]MDH5239890.1 heme ABC transporter permease CcmC [Gammaproteobacteria bacterium]MDH5260574.1 heme ABC transporter permease CcmC [Gammaproteobacteria bacterium]MDH5582323.1 heme ABC transporter permease CcmC [Gammaproteobacteria bacterium]